MRAAPPLLTPGAASGKLPRMWVILSIVTAFTNALWTALAKPVLQEIPPLRMMLQFRLVIAAVFLPAFLWHRELPRDVGFWLIVLSIGVLNGIRWVVIMHGVRQNYFSTYGMYNTAPLFTLLLAPAMLPERFGPAVWLGVLAVIAGGIVFYHTSRLSLYGLVGAVLTAIINILSKRGVSQMEPSAFLFLVAASAAVALTVAHLLTDQGKAERPAWGKELRRILPLALLCAVGAACFFYAIRLDTATRVTAVCRTNLIFGFLLSYLLLRERGQWQWKVAGTALILLGTIAVAW